jgi:hypothetical protein
MGTAQSTTAEAAQPIIDDGTDPELGFLLGLLDLFPQLRKLKGWKGLRKCNNLTKYNTPKGSKLDRVLFSGKVRDNEAAEGKICILFLQDLGLVGPFPFARLAALTYLQGLVLANNQLSGELPDYLGTAVCCPGLLTLCLQNNTGISGEICRELVVKKRVELEVENSGGRITTPFLVGASFASETLYWLMLHMSWGVHGMLATEERLQPKVRVYTILRHSTSPSLRPLYAP